MAQGDKKHFGKGLQRKGTGAGGMTDLSPNKVGENYILSNREQHSRERGQAGNAIKTQQEQDHAANRRP